MAYLASLAFLVWFAIAPVAAADLLPSWRSTEAKQKILSFVNQVTTPGQPAYVPRADRVAVFDHDGTLIIEQPIYIEVALVMDRLKEEATKNPALKDQEPYKSAIAGDVKGLAAGGSGSLIPLVAKTNAGQTSEEFQKSVDAWIKTTRQPRFNKPYDQLTYKPMTELIAFLRQRGFKVYIVSGSNIDFVRAFSQRLYGIPPEQVVGSLSKLDLVMQDHRLEVIRAPQIEMIDDGPGKPVGINRHIGKRPIMAFGNSDGDFEMLKWTTDGKGPRFGALVHHDDDRREYQYDRDSSVGQLNKALDAAPAHGWLVISMDRDWKRIFP